MSDNNDKLDELFRSRFEDVELPVSDKLLANIKQELHESKRKRRFGFWLWIVSVIAVISGVAGFVMYNLIENRRTVVVAVESSRKSDVGSESSKKEVVIETNTEHPISNELNEGAIENTNSQNADNDSKLSVKQNDGIKNFDKNEGSENVQLKETTAGLVERVGSQRNKNKALTTENEPSPLSSRKDNSKTKGKSIPQNKAENVKTKLSSEESGAQETASVKNTIGQEKSLENLNKIADKTLSLTDTDKKTESQATSLSEQNVFTNADKHNSLDSVTLGTDTVALTEMKRNVDTLKSLQKAEPLKETVQQKKKSFFVELNGGASHSFRSLNPEGNNVVQYRGTEKPLLNYTAGIDVGILFKNKYQVTVGAGIENKGEKYSFQEREALYNTTYDTAYFFVYDSINPDSVIIIDTLTEITSNMEQIQNAVASRSGKNKYQYLKLPVMFGYRFNINDNWFIIPTVGVVVNYLISGSSTRFDEEWRQYITYDTKDKYRTIVLAGRAKLDIGFNVNDKWSILVQPGYTRFLQSIYRKEESFKQYPYSYDLNVGLRCTFQ